MTVQSVTYSYTGDRTTGQFGNMTCTNRGSKPCTPMGLQFNALNNRITTSGYAYDSNGNLLTDNTHGYVYDGENRLTCVLGTDGTCTSSTAMLYFYDAAGQRVGKQQANGLEDYVYDPQGHITSSIRVSGTLLTSHQEQREGPFRRLGCGFLPVGIWGLEL